MRLQYTNTSHFPSGFSIVDPSGSMYGKKICDMGNGSTGSPPIASAGTRDITSTDLAPDGGTTLTLTHSASPTSKFAVDIDGGGISVVSVPNSFGFWAKNTGTKSKMVSIHLWDSTGAHRIKGQAAVKVSNDWQYMICQIQNWSVTSLVVGDTLRYVSIVEENAASIANSYGDWETGGTLKIGRIYVNPKSRPKFIPRTDDCFAVNVTNGSGGGYPTSGQNYKDIISYYGYRGTILMVGEWVNSSTGVSGTFLTTSQIQSLLDIGWTAVNHSYQHPGNGTTVSYGGNGLALLGPKGYYYSQQTSQGYAYGAMSDCQATSAVALTDVVTFAASTNFIAGQKVVFTDSAPTGFTVGTTYWVKTVPSASTATFSSNKDLSDTVDVTADWTGTANHRWPGSTADDTGIYNDIMLAKTTLKALGLSGDVYVDDILALPQGGWDPYVLSACKRAGIRDIWSTCTPATGQTSITTGNIVGSNNNGSTCMLDGSISLTGAIQCDGSPTLTQVKAFVDQCCLVGGSGSCVTHGISGAVATIYDGMLSYVKQREGQGLIDVVTYAEWRKGMYGG